MGRYSGKSCRMSTMFFMTAAFFLLEVVYGYMSRSMALIADSFHMLSDVLALVIAFLCMKMSKRTRTKNNTFGWIRAEVLGALVNTVFLIALSFSIILEAIQRLFEYEYIQDPENVLIVGAAGLIVNLVGLFLFHGHGGHSHGENHGRHLTHIPAEDGSSSSDSNCSLPASDKKLEKKKITASASQQMNMHGIWLHVLGDTFGSVVVIVNAIVNWQTDVEFLKRYLDPLLSLLLSFIIIGTSIPLLKESALILLQTVPPNINVEELEKKLLSRFREQITSVHEFHVWRLTGNKIVATIHVSCRNGVDTVGLAEKLKEFFHNEEIHSITTQLELSAGHQCILMCPINSSSGTRLCSGDVCCKVPDTPVYTLKPQNGLINFDKNSFPYTDSSGRSSYRRACDSDTVAYI